MSTQTNVHTGGAKRTGRMSKEHRAEVLRLKQSGMGYRRIADITGFNLSTVKSACKRSGLFADNQAHKALFTIPEPQYGTAVATVKPLPPQRVITGHKQTDAYLWVLEVIGTNELAHVASAEDALKKLTITPKQAQERYTHHLVSAGAGWTAAFSTMFMDNPQHFINRAKEQSSEAAKVRAVFGSYEAAMKPTQAEAMMLDKYGHLYASDLADGETRSMDWEEHEQEEAERQRKAEGFRDALPEPHTLSDVVREWQYWDWLYGMRQAAYKELYNDTLIDSEPYIYDREDYLSGRLSQIRPLHQREAVDVLKWILVQERFDDDNEAILFNLIGATGVE
ncbi:hypothetical protein ACMV5I_26550 [Serratia sp. T13T92]|uniref:hypothetical protein n=1 Tax=Serratia sp. T13T92 TaxID=3397496 RepID=UPI0039DFD35B